MLVNVEPLLLDALRNAEAVDLVERLEDDESHTGGPSAYHNGSEELGTEEAPTMTVEEAFAGGEEAGEDGSRETANTVYGRGADGIINLEHLVNEIDSENHQHTADGTNQGRTRCRYAVATGGDANQTGQDAVQGE